MLCESCNIEHYGTYGSGRFCKVACARRFSTVEKRVSINKKVSTKLIGRPSPLKGIKGEPRSNKVKNLIAQRASAYQQRTLLENLSLWLENKYIASTRTVRRFLIHLHGEHCQKCGWCQVHPVTRSVPVQVHHIDGKGVNIQSNVELLCPNCHSLTPNFMALNRRKNWSGKGGSNSHLTYPKRRY